MVHSNPLSKITPSCATAIVVTLLPLLYFLPATTGHIIISPDDGVIFNIPIRVAVANIIHAGHLPLWNPYMFSGMPLFGAAQAGVLFPLNWFYLAFSAPVATNLMMLASYMVAALGAYLYARRSGANVAGAALTSLVWQASGFLIGQIGHTNIVHTAALLPWLLWAIDGYGATGKRSRGVLLSVLIALQVFAGHQQTFVYSLFVVMAYALVMWWATRQSGTSTKHSRAYLWSLVFIAAGLALAAVQILPTLELLRNSMRAQASYSFFTSFSLPPRFLWTFFAPYVNGGGDGTLFRAPYVGPEFYGEYIGYLGLGTLALATLAVVLRRDLKTKFWFVVALAGILLAFGRFWPLHAYAVIYYAPVLGLFRVPARHLMEVEFAIAVLAGRGLTVVSEWRDRDRIRKWTFVVSLGLLVLTCLAVTVGRPSNFQLGRNAPVSILRAPELFLPIVFAVVTTWTLWRFARNGRRRMLLLLFVIIGADLCLWGQFSGWRRSSPKSDFELWNTPPIVESLRAHASQNKAATSSGVFRVLTLDRRFEPAKTDGPDAATLGGQWIPTLQPDIYMMYGLENAAGYDGFGLARYSRLAGDMKVWGELGETKRALNSDSREIDLLNVRYLLARSLATANGPGAAFSPETAKSSSTTTQFPPATQTYEGQRFAAESLNLAAFGSNQRLSFNLPPVTADHIALLTNLAWSEQVPDKTVVAHLRLRTENGESLDFEIRAGEHTAEWAYDRPDIRARIKHKRPTIATSYAVEDAQAKYQAHTYVSTFPFPQQAVVVAGEITVATITAAPDLTLSVFQIALADGEKAFPLRAEWVSKETLLKVGPAPAAGTESGQATRDLARSPVGQRWRPLPDVGNVAVFENMRALPRAWLAASEIVASEQDQLAIIRTGKISSGQAWNPLEQALVDLSTGIKAGEGNEPLVSGRRAEVIRHEPNEVEVKTESPVSAILVVSENHYPGWRVFVDGQSVEVLRVNFNQRGVSVPAGSHLVKFVYQPRSVLAGSAISLLTLAALLLFASPLGAGIAIRR